ncbi:pyridoxamine 5'-phosphate oxidase [Actinocorallia herbida]|uniref:Pyridoxine/pyridoxamine 5'-phosphate oxidase n=1 Tax=Actinocorallia herbida TaxID=58109 RepID=A0A3N1DCM3_9ACTN|nr:pyridoxamine 5'-phosphate oxidase [Actinocorallia herbida]
MTIVDRSLADPAHLRISYDRGELAEESAPAEPFALFTSWFADAVSAGLPEPNAMVLATASADGEPRARTVLLKGFKTDGFRFFTNHSSRKGRDLAANPRASLLFPWHPIHRQVIVGGSCEPLPPEESAAYFRSRPYGSQLGAWASHQSAVIADRAELENRFAESAGRWPEADSVPVPDFWGGYLVVPDYVEFWQGRPDRLHDRLRYTRESEGWLRERLAP